jgi:hypothetical protein
MAASSKISCINLCKKENVNMERINVETAILCGGLESARFIRYFEGSET